MTKKPHIYESIFHVHPAGTDTHAEAEGQTIKSEINERLGLKTIYGGVHFRDPGSPETSFDIEESLASLEMAGIQPGIEFNILKTDEGWGLDISPEELKSLKEKHPGLISIASIHAVKAFGFTKEEDGEDAPEQTPDSMLEIYQEMLSKYGGLLDIVGHPFGYSMPGPEQKHMEQLAETAQRYDCALEINLVNTGLLNLEHKVDHFEPSITTVQEWNPVLRFPEVLQKSDVLLCIGADFHGSTPTEKKVAQGLYPSKETPVEDRYFGSEKLNRSTLRFAASIRMYLRRHDIDVSRVINTWDSDQVEEWSKRGF